MTQNQQGQIILLNGASSAGKSTLCRAIQAQIDQPFLQFSLDFFFFRGEVLPDRRDSEGPFSWPVMRPKLFEGYFNCLSGLLDAGNNLVVDYIVETREQLAALVQRLSAFDVFYVGVHCPLEELERRELQRGDRRPGDARMDFQTVHTFSGYDFEVDSTDSPEHNAEKIIAAWKARASSGVFQQLFREFTSS
ncbi:chloramphenicol phosphotransferase CPT family protein [Deinococcus cellulosilyticus]|uniref:Putative O-phosphotransferase n=1 Tax=Deinococcus cellulosilyticus (strain DSM 18568 / NBRC 106333 / KACC 11606 / 5516J-15) TaxID=1223518 RepID=A0A511MVX5_DEIC1|nr:chloramphenicol phosphotransferase [Deinococcus cellulosilyticus]GEM44710.1 putative O-phosphotransferase [Deinococcus cellulosilyticus NBRC 106333 = KACC 11606]